jgi:mono/diheme cytochrome c family protein
MRLLAALGGLGVLGAGAVTALAAWPIGTEPERIELQGDPQRGAYLARASGCIACHSDFESGGAPLAGGAPLVTEFGTFHPPNLTSDPEAGIGAWTLSDFSRAVRQGISPDGASYYPSFPYPFYAGFTDQQMADLWAAFQTVPPVATPAPENDVSFPFDQRWGLKLWRAVYLEPPLVDPLPDRPDLWNRGRALVNGATHCGACHTGRNLAGARVVEARLAGSQDLPGGEKAPSIRPEDLAENGWTTQALAYGLKTGLTPSGDVFGGAMAEVVQEGTRFLNDRDRLAIATYLLDPGSDVPDTSTVAEAAATE